MSKTLAWRPQAAYADYFYTDASEILARRSVFRRDITNFVAYGGRGSGKTWTFADAAIVEATLRPVRVLVTRELQKSIKESIKAELEASIDARGLNHFFTPLLTEIRAANGSQFIFEGLKNNIHSIKSISDVDIVLCEESENIQKNSWEKLLPSIRPRSKEIRDTPIVIVIFNPEDELDDTYQRWIVNPPPRTISREINWRDNKYFPAHLEEQRLHCLRTAPKKEYDHIWEGKPKAPHADAIIESDWIKAARFASRHPKWPVSDLGNQAGYDPAGQGRDSHALVIQSGNIINDIDTWVISPDLREASHRAFDAALDVKANRFTYDECGGLGDGVDVFIKDRQELHGGIGANVMITPFNAGGKVHSPDDEIPGTDMTWAERYLNAKAQAHAITARKLYNTYRFVVLGHRDIEADDLLSIDVEDTTLFNTVIRELSTPIWIKSRTNSTRRVESKKEMEARTGQGSPNIADAIIMIQAPFNAPDDGKAGVFEW